MDGSRGEKTTVTQCPVCFENYTRPKYLPCLHTVCEPCIDIYIQSMQKAFHHSNRSSTDKNGFNCPVCKTFVTCSETDPKQWARALPDNAMINTLIEKQKLQKRSESCDGCKSRGDMIKAESWCSECQEALCQTCSKYHKTNKALKNHRMFNVKDLEDEPTLVRFTEDEYCVQHRDKRIEMFCKHHEALCCIICVTTSHKQCTSVFPVEDMAEGIRNSGEIAYITNQLKQANCEITQIVKDRQKNISDFTQQHHRIENDIAKLRQEVNQHIDELEQRCKKSVDVIYKENLSDMNEQVEHLQYREKAISNCQKVLQTCVKYGSDYKLFLEMVKLKHQINEHDDHIHKQKATMKRIEFRFAPSSPATNFKHYLTTLADVSITTTPYPNIETPYTSFVTSSPLASRRSSPVTSFRSVDLDLSPCNRRIDFNASSSSKKMDASSTSKTMDLNESYLEQNVSKGSSLESDFLQLSLSTSDLIGVKEADLSKTIYVNKLKVIDAAFLPEGRIMLITSHENNSRLFVYSSKGTIEKEIRLQSKPGGIAVLSKLESALTLPEEQIIQFIDNTDFSMAKDMKIRGHCHQIRSVDNKMVVVCDSEVKLFNGTSVRTIPISGSDILCLCLSAKDRLYYTVESDSSLHCVSTMGREVFKYCHGDLVCPYGVALDRGDRVVYVAGYKSQNIHQITTEGHLLTLIVTRGDVMSGPQLLAIDHDSGEFLQVWEQMYGNFIYVYDMPKDNITP